MQPRTDADYLLSDIFKQILNSRNEKIPSKLSLHGLKLEWFHKEVVGGEEKVFLRAEKNIEHEIRRCTNDRASEEYARKFKIRRVAISTYLSSIEEETRAKSSCSIQFDFLHEYAAFLRNAVINFYLPREAATAIKKEVEEKYNTDPSKPLTKLEIINIFAEGNNDVVLLHFSYADRINKYIGKHRDFYWIYFTSSGAPAEKTFKVDDTDLFTQMEGELLAKRPAQQVLSEAHFRIDRV